MREVAPVTKSYGLAAGAARAELRMLPLDPLPSALFVLRKDKAYHPGYVEPLKAKGVRYAYQ